nr:H-NS histone family protein [Burkholderia diffusa]
MPTYQELLEKMSALDKQIEAARRAERDTVLAQVRELVETYALNEKEVFGRQRNATSKRKIPPKYRNPETGETWSGRGRAPAWINSDDLSRFRIRE